MEDEIKEEEESLLLTASDFIAMAEFAGADPVRALGVFGLVYKIAPPMEIAE